MSYSFETLYAQKINVVSDCMMAVLVVHDTHVDQYAVNHTLVDIKELLSHLPQVTISFESTHTNLVAHFITSFAYESSVNHVYLTISPEFFWNVIAYDCKSL